MLSYHCSDMLVLEISIFHFLHMYLRENSHVLYVIYMCLFIYIYMHTLYIAYHNTASGALHGIFCAAAVDFINHVNFS